MDYLQILTHHIYDAFYILRWIFENLTLAFSTIFRPLTWIFSVLKGFWASATGSPITPEISVEITGSVKTIYESIPYWSQIQLALGLVILILVLTFVFRKLANF